MEEYLELIREGIIKTLPDGSTTIFGVDSWVFIVPFIIFGLFIMGYLIYKDCI